jgi:hypothetical protein
MPHRRFDWHERIKAVEREYLATRRAVDRLSADVARDAGILGEGPSPRDLRSAEENLEGTYLIRMSAEFETGVRSFWRTTNSRAGAPAEILLDRVDEQAAPRLVDPGNRSITDCSITGPTVSRR